jgi:hypothetical protein
VYEEAAAFDAVAGKLWLARHRAMGLESVAGEVYDAMPGKNGGSTAACGILLAGGERAVVDMTGFTVFDTKGSGHMYLEVGDRVEIFPPDPEKDTWGIVFIL